MIFNSISYFIFLPLFFLLYWFVFNKSLKWQNLLIITASYVFYAWWDWRFLGLLILSTLIDYGFGFLVAEKHGKRRKLFLWLSIVNNLAVLGIFKYYNFFIEQFSTVLSALHINFSPSLLNVVLPVGISFYTFHGMSYVLDIYRGRFKPVNNFVDYAVFVCFFPLLVAGPIERAGHLIPQIQTKRVFNYQQAVAGLRLILFGLFKKMIIADGIAHSVDFIFQNYPDLNGSKLLFGALFFGIQIYADFSGYTDIATGSAKLLGMELLVNFRYPYFSKSLTEFWRRWHISLSSWFNDYLYTELLLKYRDWGKKIIVFGLIFTFFISGFWHGAGWTFIIWGLCHGIWIALEFITKKQRKNLNSKFPEWVGNWVSRGVLMLFLVLTWVLFRAPNIQVAGAIYGKIFSMSVFTNPAVLKLDLFFVLLILVFDYLHFDKPMSFFTEKIKYPVIRWSIYLIMIVLILGVGFYEKSDFIYFQF